LGAYIWAEEEKRIGGSESGDGLPLLYSPLFNYIIKGASGYPFPVSIIFRRLK
jgi:hypothetical protein